MKILITGSAGFIGYHLAIKFLSNGYEVVGIDNLNSYYDIKLKKIRLKKLSTYKNFHFVKSDISNFKTLKNLFKKYKFKYVFNLAAQAGVRYSIENPKPYVDSNIIGFYNISKLCVEYNVKQLFYASTSSVYGDQNKFPLKENFNTDKPLSFYAATKKMNEINAYAFFNIHKLSSVGLRFFTVYGPLGRPDMSLYKFIQAGQNNQPIDLYNYGNHTRDFTYVSDIVDSIYKLFIKSKTLRTPIYKIFNLGNSKPVTLKKFVKVIEKNLNKKLKINYLPMQKGDVEKTHSSSVKLYDFIKFKPKISIEQGVKNFYEWYISYYK